MATVGIKTKSETTEKADPAVTANTPEERAASGTATAR